MAKVLIIDDDPAILQILQEVLKIGGHESRTASDGDEGLRHLHEDAFDLVVTDLVMPNKEGVETIVEIRKTWPQLPVLAMSGGGSAIGGPSYLKIARALGANAVLAKPFRHREFLDTVKQTLGDS